MEMRFEYINGVLVAHVQMFLDQVGAENFKYVLGERMKEGEKIVLDLEKLVNIDNYGLDALLAMAQKALENHSVIKLARVSADMQIVLIIPMHADSMLILTRVTGTRSSSILRLISVRMSISRLPRQPE